MHRILQNGGGHFNCIQCNVTENWRSLILSDQDGVFLACCNLTMLIRLKHCTLDARRARTVCVCICCAVKNWRYCALVVLCLAPYQITLQKLFLTWSSTGYGPRHVRFCRKQCCEIVNVIVIVPVTWSDKINLSMISKCKLKSSMVLMIGLNGMADFSASACPLPRRHHWWIAKVPCPVCRYTALAGKGTNWMVTRWRQSCKHHCKHSKQVCCRARVTLLIESFFQAQRGGY